MVTVTEINQTDFGKELNRRELRSLAWGGLIQTISLLLLIPSGAVALYFGYNYGVVSEDIEVISYNVPVVFGCLIIIFFFRGLSIRGKRKCPSCRSTNTTVSGESEKIETTNHYSYYSHRIEHTDTEFKTTGYSYIERDVPEVTTSEEKIKILIRKCLKCSQSWETKLDSPES